MPFEKFDLENLDKERRKAIAKSIRTVSVEELKKLGGEVFLSSGSSPRTPAPHFITRSRATA